MSDKDVLAETLENERPRFNPYLNDYNAHPENRPGFEPQERPAVFSRTAQLDWRPERFTS